MSHSSLPYFLGTDEVLSYLGDIRIGAKPADANGYYRMDGRAAGVLDASGQTGLTALGLTGIPNVRNKVIRMGGAPGTLGGAATVTMTKANMPNVNMVGTTPAGGAHNHSLNNNVGVRNSANLNPRAQAGNVAANSAEITVNPNNNPHNHTITAPTGGSGTPITLQRRTVAAYHFICLNDAIKNTWRPIIGDLKYSMLTADHNGWILMNGRAVNTLTPTQQAAAATLGFLTNLPNGTGYSLKMKGAIGLTGGATTRILTVANLPAINVTATSSTSPNTHNHSLVNGNVLSSQVNPQFDHVKNAQRTMPARTVSMRADGAHTHPYTLAIAGNNAPLSILMPYLVLNDFIYLGA